MRDEAARQKFKNEIGHVGITLQVELLSSHFACLVSSRTLFNSKGLEYEDVSRGVTKILGTCLTLRMCNVFVQVILYNFFEESADANLWLHLVDEDHNRLEDLKHAPLIYEVSVRVAFHATGG